MKKINRCCATILSILGSIFVSNNLKSLQATICSRFLFLCKSLVTALNLCLTKIMEEMQTNICILYIAHNAKQSVGICFCNQNPPMHFWIFILILCLSIIQLIFLVIVVLILQHLRMDLKPNQKFIYYKDIQIDC